MRAAPGTVGVDGDCHITDATVYPGAPEICDGQDNDCDGVVDMDDADVVVETWYTDADGDGDGDRNGPNFGCPPDGYWSTIGGDCDDNDPLIRVGTVRYADRDGDGYGDSETSTTACEPGYPTVITPPVDCDDTDPDFVGPCPERCNDGWDNDRNHLVDCEDPDCPQSCGPDTELGACWDGIDNDADGLVDDDDDDCAHQVCLPAQERCNNGLDDDLDGLTDCDDSDCEWAGGCYASANPPAERCDDGQDNDHDGLVDCEDADCAGNAWCEERCDNSYDDDQDGFVDCWDSDCFGPECAGASKATVHGFELRGTWRHAQVNSLSYYHRGDVLEQERLAVEVAMASGRVQISDGYGGVADTCWWTAQDVAASAHSTHIGGWYEVDERMTLGRATRVHVEVDSACPRHDGSFLPASMDIDQHGAWAAARYTHMTYRPTWSGFNGQWDTTEASRRVAHWYPAAGLEIADTTCRGSEMQIDGHRVDTQHRTRQLTWSSTSLAGEPFYAPAAP